MKIKDDFRQIWRNHLLGLAMLKNNQIDVFTHIHLYPKENGHFEEILPIYENKLLTEIGRKTFLALTYEELFSEMEKGIFPGEFRPMGSIFEREVFILNSFIC